MRFFKKNASNEALFSGHYFGDFAELRIFISLFFSSFDLNVVFVTNEDI